MVCESLPGHQSAEAGPGISVCVDVFVRLSGKGSISGSTGRAKVKQVGGTHNLGELQYSLSLASTPFSWKTKNKEGREGQ